MRQLSGAQITSVSENALRVRVWFGDLFHKQVWFPKNHAEVRTDGGVWASPWILNERLSEERRYGNPQAPEIAVVAA